MYIHSLSGSWLQHPFWKNSFLLDAEEDLLRLKQSGIRDVVIDLSRAWMSRPRPRPKPP